MKTTTRKFTGIISMLFMLYSFLLIPDCLSQWVLVGNGLVNTTFYSLTANSNTVFAGGGISNSNVFLSTNYGGNWTVSLSLNLSFYSLAANGNNIFAGSDGMGVYYSSNNGASWTQTSLNNRTVNALAVNGNNVFAGTNNYGIYKTSNNGVNWTQTSLNTRTVRSFAVKGDTMYAGTNDSGVYISIDSGANWTQTSLNYRWVLSLAIKGNNVFAGTSGYGVYLSTDNGATWVQTSLTSPSVWALAVSGNNVFAGLYVGGVYVSNNNGANWTAWNDGGLSGQAVRSLCVMNNYIFTIPNSRVYRRPLSDLTGISPVSNEIPDYYKLHQNYPNPFNPKTIINYQLPVTNFVKLAVYDITGKEVTTLVNEQLKPGNYKVEFDASHLPSGIYFYNMRAGNFNQTKKMILIK